MNAQLLRIVIAGLLSAISLLGIIALALVGQPIPEALQATSLGSTLYLFGVATNGSGLGTRK